MCDKFESARLIAIDWGTSSLRAWLLDGNGCLLDSRATRQGIMQIGDRGFQDVYQNIVGHWNQKHDRLPVIACGMIGSRGGWVEVPYVECPAELGKWAGQLHFVDAKPVPLHIVPGVKQHSAPGVLPDVMRGEETQILGTLATEPGLVEHSLLVLPGTHSKWATVEKGCLNHFSTYMTGELFSILNNHSILGRVQAEVDEECAQAFDLGLDTARTAGRAGIASTLFSARSRVLAEEIEAVGVPDYLSGLLIGDELRSALAGRESVPPLRLIGDHGLCARYRVAFERFGVVDIGEVPDAACSGLWRIAEAADLAVV